MLPSNPARNLDNQNPGSNTYPGTIPMAAVARRAERYGQDGLVNQTARLQHPVCIRVGPIQCHSTQGSSIIYFVDMS